MTEKWIIKNGEIVNTATNMTFDSFIEILTILNGQSRHLNQMAKEKKKLKSICKDHRDHAMDFKADCVRLEKENEQLKHRIKKLQNELDKYSEIFDELNGLVDENEQLKNIMVFAYTLMSRNTISDEEYFEFYELCENMGVSLND